MQRAVEPELRHPLERGRHLRLVQDDQQLVAQPRRGQVADEPHVDAPLRQRERVGVHGKPSRAS